VLATTRKDGSPVRLAGLVPLDGRGLRGRDRPRRRDRDQALDRRPLPRPEAGERFAAERASKPGVLLRLVPVEPRVWDLEDILPY
jgi:hypothetical protein